MVRERGTPSRYFDRSWGLSAGSELCFSAPLPLGSTVGGVRLGTLQWEAEPQ